MNEMLQKLQLLHPEMALFVTTCVVMALGLSRSYAARKSCAIVTAIGLVVAGALGLASPGVDSPLLSAITLAALAPFAKPLVAGVGLLLLPVLMGTVDRAYEKSISRGAIFDPIRATRGEFYAFFLFSLTGVMLCVTADDLIWLFLALELTSLPTYIMVAMSTSRLRSQEAGVKYFFLGAFGAAIFLYGFALIYGATGHTNLWHIRTSIAQAGGLGGVALLGFVMAIIGVSFKIAAAPMHFYTPDVYQGAATPVAAYLAFAPKAAGFFALLGLLAAIGWTHGEYQPGYGTSLPEEIRLLLWVMAALTMTVGNVLALLQTSVKRILAYSSISHSGYMLVGLIAGPGHGTIASNGLGAMMFYLLCYGVMNLGAFAALAALEKRGVNGERIEIETMADLRGVARSHPALGWSMAICSLSLLGMPPLLGFFGKLLLFTSAISAGEILLVVVMGVNSAIAALYYLRLAAAPLLDARDAADEMPSASPAAGRRIAAVISAIAVVALAVVVSPLMRASDRATKLRPPMLISTEAAPVAPQAPAAEVARR